MNPAALHVLVLSIHPAYDTRIGNHLTTLLDAGHRVTYLNGSAGAGPWAVEPGERLIIVHRDASPVFGVNVFRYAWMLLWMLWSAWRRPGSGGAKPDVVHLHDLLLLPLSWPLRWLLRRPVVFDVHENYLEVKGPHQAFARWCYRWLLGAVGGYIVVSPAFLPSANKPWRCVPNYQPRRPMELARERVLAARSKAGGEVSEGIDAGNRDAESGGAEPFRVVYVGSLSTDDREVALLAEVAEICLKRSPRVRFTLGGKIHGAGADACRERFERLAAAEPARFEWLGPTPREVALERTAGADVGLWFVKDQPNNHGSSPVKVFECLAAGVVVCATDCFAVAPRLREADAALLFPFGASAPQVADALLSLAADPPRLARMKQASLALGAEFSWESVGSRYLELYAELRG